MPGRVLVSHENKPKAKKLNMSRTKDTTCEYGIVVIERKQEEAKKQNNT
jgi:phosphopantetheine adenylyltransferase